MRNVENSIEKKKHNFGESKICKPDQVRKFLVNPKIENVVFG